MQLSTYYGNSAVFITVVMAVTGTTGQRPMECEEMDKQAEPTSQSLPRTFLWSIEEDKPTKRGVRSYFFGTIHVPYTRVWEHVAPVAKRAFDDAQSVFFELDLANRKTMKSLSRCQLLPAGESISDHVPSSIYDRLVKHMDYLRENLPFWMEKDGKLKSTVRRNKRQQSDFFFKNIAGNWQRRRPIWLLFLINSLTRASVRSHGVPVLDLFLAREAQSRGKIVGAVERPADQCEPLNHLETKQVLFVLNRTLSKFERLWNETERGPSLSRDVQSEEDDDTHTDEIVHHYNCGSLNARIFNRDTTQLPIVDSTEETEGGVSQANGRASAIDAYFRRELIDKRNVRMANRVVALLQQKPRNSYFFAFGAGHFLGDNSILELVQKAGYKVQPVVKDSELNTGSRYATDIFARPPSYFSSSAGINSAGTSGSSSLSAYALAENAPANELWRRENGKDNSENGGNSNFNIADSWRTLFNPKEVRMQRDDSSKTVGGVDQSQNWWRRADWSVKGSHDSDWSERDTWANAKAARVSSSTEMNYHYYYILHNGTRRLEIGRPLFIVVNSLLLLVFR